MDVLRGFGGGGGAGGGLGSYAPWLMGASLLGDIGGGVGNYFQAQRQRDIFNQMMNPGAIAANARAYADPVWKTIGPQMAREAAGTLGQMGVSQGAYGQKLLTEALANQYLNQYNQGAGNFLSRMGLAAQTTGPTFPMGASMGALRDLTLMQALGRYNPITDSSLGGATAAQQAKFDPYLFDTAQYNIPGGY